MTHIRYTPHRPTGTYGNPGYGEPHPIVVDVFGHEPCDQPTAEQVDADHGEALEMNARNDEFEAAFEAHIARIRANLAASNDFGDTYDYDPHNN